MNKTVAGEENPYLELESKQTTGAGIYEGLLGENEVPATTTAKTNERRETATKLRQPTEPAFSSDSDAVIVRRLLSIVTAVVVLSVLTVAATLILAITMMTFRNSPTDCASVQEYHSTDAMKSPDHRIVRVTENITSLENRLEEKVQYLTDRLESSQFELKTLKNLLNGQLKDMWMVVNVTTEETSNLANKFNQTAMLLKSFDASLFALLIDVNATITEKVNNVTKMAGPIGPSGFNGSQGPAGPAGSVGPPGFKGAGNFSSCHYKVKTELQSPGDPVVTAGQNEPIGKRILGASCSTNSAAEYNLFSILIGNVRRYGCTCKGTSTLFSPSGGQQKSCSLHYWECPLTN